MTANDSTPVREQESTDAQPTDAESESGCGLLMAESFLEPETAVVDVKATGDIVQIVARQAESGRGLTTQWMLPVGQAREFVGEMSAAIGEIEDDG